MTMHLVGPWLTTTGKKRGGRRYRTADAAAQARKNRDAWQQLLDKYDIRPNTVRTDTVTRLPGNPGPYRRDNGPRIPSVDTGRGTAAASPAKQYTGTECIGVTVLHKSCLQPVFDKQSAIDAAKMRR
jgi:hypothetical protein